MTYYIKTIVIGFFLLFTISKTFAQPPTFTLEDINASTGSSFCMEITTSEIVDLFAMDFSINWDETLLDLTSVQNLNSNLAGAIVNTSGSNSGVITFSFFAGSVVTLPANDLIFELCFDVIGTTGGSTDVLITGMPTPIDVGTFGGVYNTINQIGGTVTFPTPLVINMPDQIQSPGSAFCIPVSVENFNNIENIQNAIIWDENVIQFDSVTAFNLSDLSGASFGYSFATDGLLSFSWNDQDADPFNGVTLPDGTVIFELCFTVVGNVNDMTTIVFTESTNPLVPVEVFEFGNPTNLGLESNGGKINIQQIIFITNVELTQPNCYDANGGMINISVGGATGPYTYLWSNDSTTQDLTGLGIGTYTITITDSEMPANQYITSYTLSGNFTTPTADAGPFAMIDCANPTVVLDGSASSSGTDIVYNWTHGGGTATILNEDTTMPTVNATGVYTITVTDTLNGCSATDQTIVDGMMVPPLVEAGAPDTLTCGILTLQLNGSVDPSGSYTYLWSTSDGSIISGENTLTPEIDSAGTYELLVTEMGTGCTATDQVTITLNNDTPIADAGASMTINCSNATVTLDGSGASSGTNITYLWTGPGTIINATTTTPTVDATGTYTIEVTNTISECTATATVVVDDNFIAPTAIAADMNAEINCMVNNVTLDGSGSSTGANFSYLWTTNNGNIAFDEMTLSPTVDAAGEYFLTVTDNSNGCTAVDSTTVTQDASIPNADAGPDRTFDCNTTSVVLDGSDSDIGPQFKYLWTANPGNIVSGATTFAPTVDAGGIYTLEVTDTISMCSSTSTVTVFMDTIPPTSNPDNPPFLTCSSPEIVLLGGSANAGVNIGFNWYTDGGNIIDATPQGDPIVNQVGEYCLVMTDFSNNCADTACVIVQENNMQPTAVAGADFELNCGQTSAMLDGTGSSTGNEFIYNWTALSGNNPTNETTLNPSISSVGQFIITVTDTINGCMDMDTVVVTQADDFPIVEAGANGTITCTDPEIILDASLVSSSGPGFQIEWTGPNPIIDGNTLTPTVSQPGGYTLTITNLSNNCSANDQLIVFANNTPPIAVVVEDTIEFQCDQDMITLDGTGSTASGVEYLWQTLDGNIIDGETTLMPNVNQGGTYFLYVSSSDNGCVDTASVYIPPQDDQPFLEVVLPDNLTCNSPQVTIDGSGSVLLDNQIFQWVFGPSGNIISGENTLTPTVDSAAVYTLVVTDTISGCTFGTSAFVLEDVTEVEVSAMADGDINCQTNMVNLEGVLTTNSSNVITAWTTSNGIISPASDTTTLMIVANSSGEYILMAMDTLTGCADTTIVEVFNNTDAPIADAGMNMELPCGVSFLELDGTASSSGNDFIYLWTTMDGMIMTGGNTLTPEVSSIGTYLLTVTDTTNGCSTTSQVEVQNPLAVTAFATTPVQLDCGVISVTLDGTGSTTGATVTYIWTTNNGTIESGGTTLNPEVSTAGIYTLMVTDNQSGCTATTEVEVIFNNTFPGAMAGEDIFACDEDINLMAILPADATGIWLSLGSAVATDPSNPASGVSNLQVGENVFVWSLSAIGCPEYSADTVSIFLENPPQAQDDSYSIEEDQMLDFDVSTNDLFTNGQIQNLTNTVNGLLVNNGSGSFTYTPNMGYVGLEEFEYELCSESCPDVCDIATVSIFVNEKEPLPLDSLINQKTNTITPNGDGLNDNFVFDILVQNFDDYPNNEFLVFNRWGDIVYEASPYTNDWNGTNKNGKPLPEGTYYYILRLDLAQGIILKGDVTILR